jgi:hypothetical protein
MALVTLDSTNDGRNLIFLAFQDLKKRTLVVQEKARDLMAFVVGTRLLQQFTEVRRTERRGFSAGVDPMNESHGPISPGWIVSTGIMIGSSF